MSAAAPLNYENYEQGTEGSQTGTDVPKQKKNAVHYVIGAVVITAIVIGLIVGLAIYYRSPNMHSSSAIASSNKTHVSSNVTVFYAGSLVSIMSSIVNPDFTKNNNIGVKIISGGSGALDTDLEQGQFADVFISAAVNDMSSLLTKSIGGSSEPVIDWYTYYAGSTLGLGYNIKSKYAANF